jgi:hypothetical protein
VTPASAAPPTVAMPPVNPGLRCDYPLRAADNTARFNVARKLRRRAAVPGE